jgi:hypothetical protein
MDEQSKNERYYGVVAALHQAAGGGVGALQSKLDRANSFYLCGKLF